jgi:hypothetical protein
VDIFKALRQLAAKCVSFFFGGLFVFFLAPQADDHIGSGNRSTSLAHAGNPASKRTRHPSSGDFIHTELRPVCEQYGLRTQQSLVKTAHCPISLTVLHYIPSIEKFIEYIV